VPGNGGEGWPPEQPSRVAPRLGQADDAGAALWWPRRLDKLPAAYSADEGGFQARGGDADGGKCGKYAEERRYPINAVG
jgi:hypothetical protein